MTYLVRDAVPGDAPGIAAVHVAAWQWAYAGLLPADFLDGLSVQGRADMWLGALESPTAGSALLVAVAEPSAGTDRDEAIVGFVSVGPGRPDVGGAGVAELYAIYVVEAVAGLGVGRRLHDAGLTRLASAGFTEARLWVLEGNARGRGFYERRGWRPDGEVKDDTLRGGVPVRELRLSRELA